MHTRLARSKLWIDNVTLKVIYDPQGLETLGVSGTTISVLVLNDDYDQCNLSQDSIFQALDYENTRATNLAVAAIERNPPEVGAGWTRLGLLHTD